MINSITGVLDAKDKLSHITTVKYPSTTNIKYTIGIDPENGKYTVLVILQDKSHTGRFPKYILGYRVVIDGITELHLPKGYYEQ